MSKETKIESWGDSAFGFFLVVAILVVLFHVDPDIAESLRVWIGKAAGTIPVDYVWTPDE